MLEGLRGQWRAIPNDRKVAALIALFVAPVVVGLILIFVDRNLPVPPPTSIIVQVPTARPTTAPTPRPEMLEIVRVQSVESADDANGKGLPPAIDVTLRNLGETVAVVTAAEVTIRTWRRRELRPRDGSTARSPSATASPFLWMHRPDRPSRST